MNKYVLVICIIFSMATQSFGKTWTNESGIDNLWSTTGNWDTGVPGTTDSVYIGANLAEGPTIDSTVTAVGGWTAIGMGGSALTKLTMTGGSLTVTGLVIGQNLGTGWFNMSGGTANCSGWVSIGAAGTGSAGLVEMYGSSSFTASSLMVGDGAGASGTILLNGSAILTVQNSIWFRDSSSHPHVDIKSNAKLIVPVSQLSSVNTYISNGWITGYGSSTIVKVSTVGSQLEITAPLDSCEDVISAGLKLDSDFNGDCVVNFVDFSTIADEWLATVTYGQQPYYDVTIPQGTVVVDGVMSTGEWDGAAWHVIDQLYDGYVGDVTEAKWAAKWNSGQNLLYVVVTLLDTHKVRVSSYTDWNTNDSVEFYVSFPNSGTVGYNSDYAYAQHYIGGVSNIVGNEWLVLGGGASLPSGAVVAYQAAENGTRYTYEIALKPYTMLDIATPANSVPMTLAAGNVIALDIVIGSSDGSSFGMLTGKINWPSKFSDATRFMKAKLVP